MKGYIYLLQPPKMIGTNVFKIGETKDMNQRLNINEYGTMVQWSWELYLSIIGPKLKI